MFGGSSIKLARVFGVRIGVEPSWFVVLFALIYFLSIDYREQFTDTTAFALAVVSALLFFASVLLHELGHAVVAIRNKIGISGIDLWMFGGVAKMDRDTDSAGVEFRVAVAGPVVTLLIAAACFGVGTLISGSGGVADAAVFNSASSDAVLQVLGYLTFINVVLLLFNLIPGFPLDGGRIARAIAWKVTGDRVRATRFAALLGRGFSWLMIAAGAYLLLVAGDVISGIWLGFVGVFLGQAARGAEQQSALSSRIEGLRVADVMDDEPVAIPAELTLARAEEEFFLRYRYPWFPVVDDGGRFVGLVTETSVEGLPEAVRAGRTVASVMAAEGDGAESRLRVGTEEPLESLLSLEGLTRLGAIMAVDGEGRLRGIVTAGEVRRALSAPASRPVGAQG
ncbi:MAG: site-2 protease family protein [Thermoleophilaceae bacterium]